MVRLLFRLREKTLTRVASDCHTTNGSSILQFVVSTFTQLQSSGVVSMSRRIARRVIMQFSGCPLLLLGSSEYIFICALSMRLSSKSIGSALNDRLPSWIGHIGWTPHFCTSFACSGQLVYCCCCLNSADKYLARVSHVHMAPQKSPFTCEPEWVAVAA